MLQLAKLYPLHAEGLAQYHVPVRRKKMWKKYLTTFIWGGR